MTPNFYGHGNIFHWQPLADIVGKTPTIKNFLLAAIVLPLSKLRQCGPTWWCFDAPGLNHTQLNFGAKILQSTTPGLGQRGRGG
jgi:hypothetical protein